MKVNYVNLALLAVTVLVAGCDSSKLDVNKREAKVKLIEKYSGERAKNSIIKNIENGKAEINNIRGDRIDGKRLIKKLKSNKNGYVGREKSSRKSDRGLDGYSVISVSSESYGGYSYREAQFQSISRAESSAWNSGFTWIKNKMNIGISSTNTNINITEKKSGTAFNQVYSLSHSVDYSIYGEKTSCSLDTKHIGYFYGSYNAWSVASVSC